MTIMRIILLALLVYSTAVFAAKCDSYGQKVASNLRTLFTDDEKCHLLGVEPVKYPEDAKVPVKETRATHESVPPKSYQKLDPGLRAIFQRVSRRAHDIEQHLKLEEHLMQKELECEAELAKLKRQSEISNNVASVLAEVFVKDFQSLLEIQKKNP